MAGPRVGRFALGAALSLLLAGCGPSDEGSAPAPQASSQPTAQSGGTTQAGVVPQGAGFDFYVLSLSWSPSYCEAEGAAANGQQCASGRPYAFVVHGLWPQDERGYPQDCRTDEPDVAPERLSALYDIMPSAGLIRHEWRKHGTCSGLEQDSYFRVLRMAREKVAVPDEFRRLDAYRTLSPQDVEKAFLVSNPGLSGGAVAVTCDRRYLREVRICMSRDLHFRDCPQVDRRDCKLPKVVMPPVRGN